jgi:16S rRNA (uracil1498-N3)-methyltransferase
VKGAGEVGEAPEAHSNTRPPVFLADRADLERDSIVLSGAEGRHAATVRRLAVGERADVTDGAGTIAECVVTGVRPGVAELAVLATRAEPAAQPRIVVVQAIPKGDRGELAVEIMTEVGVDAVVAWQAERCVARWRADRAGKALARWQATAREAAKQARRAWIPEVTGPEATPAIARRVGAAELAILLDPEAPAALGRIRLPGRGEIVVIVGPEGGVSPAEAGVLTRAGAIAARLGPTVLRSSSAGAVAAAVALARSPRWP